MENSNNFFPDNAVGYLFKYDYYQPGAYMPVSNTYIEKDLQHQRWADKLLSAGPLHN